MGLVFFFSPLATVIMVQLRLQIKKTSGLVLKKQKYLIQLVLIHIISCIHIFKLSIN